MRSRIVTFITVAQLLMFLTHWFLYETWVVFLGMSRSDDPRGLLAFQIAMAVLSISFVTTSVLAFRSSSIFVRFFYTCAAVWLGTLNYLVFAACGAWIVYGVSVIGNLQWHRPHIAMGWLGLALLVSLYGVINAAWTRVTRITIRLSNLPDAWRGRVIALVSDMHLGHVRNYRFVKRIVRMLAQLRPDIVLLDGDLYDGTRADLDRLAQPWSELDIPHGIYFTTGNHEEFTNRAKYLEAMTRARVRVLNNEKVIIEGLQLIGMHYRESVNPQLFRSILRAAAIDRGRASILLTHAPDRPAVAEQEGISLQLSGHTHGGQFLPYTFIASRVYRQFVHGLSRIGNLQVFTNWGAGTWGPPMRVGTKPEIVLIRLEAGE